VLLVVAVALLVAVALASVFFLLRQNGRLLLRLESLEEKLRPATAPEPGLPVNTPAPPFSLKGPDGKIATLDMLLERGKPVLLFFSEPGCSTCDAAWPELAGWQLEHRDRLAVVPVAGGDASTNLRMSKKYHLKDLLLDHKDVAAAYRVDVTPSAVLVANGLIASPLATGIDAIRGLVGSATTPPPLKKGDLVPSLQLPDLKGDTLDLATLRGRSTLLLFWDPGCGFCRQMLEDIKNWERGNSEPSLVIVSAGSSEANQKQGFRSRLLLDTGFRVGRTFGANGTPSAVIVDEQGRIASDVGVGAAAVLELAGATPASCAVLA
jgi:peroxiredoxin